MPASRSEAPAPTIAAGALSALLHDLVRGAEPGSSWERALRPGAVIGRFELVRELGRGGFGIVYEARDRELGRAVALKAVRAGDRLDLRQEQLLREAEAAARLSHPNLVTLFDVGHCEHGPYLVLELLRGETLAQRLAQGPVSVREALRVGAAIARGLAHAHAEGVVHRDLTPGNVFLCQDGQVKVLDLGLAHAFGRRRLDGGTPGFMAPEQRRGAPEDERTDVFALGVILYRMLAGEPPFPGDGPHRARGPAPALDVPEVPALGQVIGRMLALDPVDRPRDAGDVSAALDAFERELRSASGGPSAPVLRQRRWRARMAGIGAAGAVLAVAMAGGLILRARGPDGGRARPEAARAETSIAVLPFQDMSPGRDQEYLADGIAEEILNALAQVEDLRVIGRTSSFSFKGKGDDLATIARKLRVARLLEGSLRREASRVRITTQLVDAEGQHLWSRTFDRELSGIFALQDEIARAVVAELEVKLRPGGAPTTRERSTGSVEAYREYLLGRRFALEGTREGHVRAIAAFERSVAADPSYGPAWAGLAIARSWFAETHSDRSVVEAIDRRALEDAERAIAVRPSLPDGYAARGLLRQIRVPADWQGVGADFRRALELNPRDAATLRYYGAYFLAGRGDLAEGIATVRRSAELDPLAAETWFDLGRLYAATDLPLARTTVERAIEIAPDGHLARYLLTIILALQGKGPEARAAADQVRDELFRPIAIALAEETLGHRVESERALSDAIRRSAGVAAFQIAEVYAFRGERERALEWLERAWDQRDTGLNTILIDPMFRTLREEPRFKALLRKLGLPTG